MLLLVQNWGKMAHLLQQGPVLEILYIPLLSDVMALHHPISNFKS